VQDRISYCERFLEWTIDLLTQIPTRRFFLAYLMDSHFIQRSILSPLYQLRQPKAALEPAKEVGEVNEDEESDDEDDNEEKKAARAEKKRAEAIAREIPGVGKLFSQLLDMVKYYQGFEIDPKTGSAISDMDMVSKHAAKMISLGKVAFKYFPTELKSLALSNVASLETRQGLNDHLSRMETPSLRRLAQLLGLVGPKKSAAAAAAATASESRELLLEILLSHFELRKSQTKVVQSMSIFPDEKILWDTDLVPSMHYSGDSALALPKVILFSFFLLPPCTHHTHVDD
jgi:intron-binding protein aquarius